MSFQKFLHKEFKKIVENIDSDIPDNSINYNQSDYNQDEDNRLFNILDPETNERYDIPMLSTTSPDYYFKYVYYMRIKEASPETFERILSWE